MTMRCMFPAVTAFLLTAAPAFGQFHGMIAHSNCINERLQSRVCAGGALTCIARIANIDDFQDFFRVEGLRVEVAEPDGDTYVYANVIQKGWPATVLPDELRDTFYWLTAPDEPGGVLRIRVTLTGADLFNGGIWPDPNTWSGPFSAEYNFAIPVDACP